MKKTNQLNIRVEDTIFQPLEKYAKLVDRLPSDFVRLLIESCLEMVENPSARVVPPIIQDVIDRQERTPIPLVDTEKRRAKSA